MVDPISIATAAAGLVGVCVKLSGQLYTFVSKVRNVDESIQTLQFEINSLSLALGSIKLSFEDPLLAEAISNSQARHERRHWQNVRHSLDHCLNTLTRLDGILGNVENCEGQFLVNVRKRIRLDMKSGEMLLLKEQIASCRRTLQLSLQLITVSSLFNHGLANEALATRLDALMEEMQTFRNEFRHRRHALAAEQRFNENDVQIMDNLDDCIRSAEVIAEVASTTISIRSTGSYSRQHVRDRTALWIENHALADDDNNGLSTITSDTAAMPITPSASTVVRVQSVVTPSMTSVGFHGTESLFSVPNEQIVQNVDFFDYVQPRLIRTWLNEGKAQFDLQNYADAREYMKTIVASAREIQYEGKVEVLEESLNLLAKCYRHLDDLPKAVATLGELLNDNTRTALQAAETQHALADVYLLKEDHESAQKSCEEAIRNKARLLSHNHESVYSSVVLLVQILEAKGSSHIAIAYKKEILPPDTEIPKRTTRREIQKAILQKLISMDRKEAAEKLGRLYFPDLIPGSCRASQELQWMEIRNDWLQGGVGGGSAQSYTLLHACAEYGHEQLLTVLLELGFPIDKRDPAGNVPLARAVIGHENGIKVPASISRILLENKARVGSAVATEGVYAFQKPRPSGNALYLSQWPRNKEWPWPETADLRYQKAREQGYAGYSG